MHEVGLGGGGPLEQGERRMVDIVVEYTLPSGEKCNDSLSLQVGGFRRLGRIEEDVFFKGGVFAKESIERFEELGFSHR